MGVHTGQAFVGVVGGSEDRPTDFTALGDNVNITARLAAQAGAGEILVSDAAAKAASRDVGGAQFRQLELKGKPEPVDVWLLRL